MTFNPTDSTFTYIDFETKYCGNNNISLEECANDLASILRVIAGNKAVLLKTLVDGRAVVNYTKYNTAIDSLKQIQFTEMTPEKVLKHSAYKAFLKYKQNFNVVGMKFYKPHDPLYISVFNGLFYKTDAPINEDLIKPFLGHVHDIICSGNEEIYNFILDWIAFVIQKPYNKTKSVICLVGDQGTGKNIFTKVVCEMLRNYSVVANKIEQILGKNNSIIENKRIVIGDEVSAFHKAKLELWNSFKHDITEYEGMFEDKYVPQHPGDNVANYILVSNNGICVPVEETDRRYLILQVSNAHIQDEVYFDALCADIWSIDAETGEQLPNEAFFDSLTTFFYTRKLKNTRLDRVPDTKEKALIKETFKSNVESFIEDFYDKLTSEEGFEKRKAREYFCDYLRRQDTEFTFARKLNKYCLKNEIDEHGKVVKRDLDKINGYRVYKLTEEYEKKFAPN